MLPVLVTRPVGVNQDVVNVGRAKLVQVVAERPVDVFLKSAGGVGQAERRYQPFKKAIPGSERRHPLVALTDADFVECGNNVKLGEPLCSPDVSQGLVDQRDRIAVLPGELVECAVVDTKPEAAAWLLNKQHRRCGRGVANTDETFVEVLD